MSTQVVFANMPKSPILETHVREELSKALEGHTGAAGFKTRVKLEMENSPFQAGLDAFRVFVNLRIKGLKPIILKKHGSNMYHAVRDSMDALRQALAKAHEVRKERKHRRHMKRSQRKLKAELLNGPIAPLELENNL
jgi:ribosome-associated translation inhibitor RaiA